MHVSQGRNYFVRRITTLHSALLKGCSAVHEKFDSCEGCIGKRFPAGRRAACQDHSRKRCCSAAGEGVVQGGVGVPVSGTPCTVVVNPLLGPKQQTQECGLGPDDAEGRYFMCSVLLQVGTRCLLSEAGHSRCRSSPQSPTPVSHVSLECYCHFLCRIQL